MTHSTRPSAPVRPSATVMRLYMTVRTCAFFRGDVLVEILSPRKCFNGRPDGFLVRRYSGRGGSCDALNCVEVV
jgi:hypothetical protein